MIPGYEKFVSRHTFFYGIGCCIAMTILTSSLARNSVTPDAWAMFFGLSAIAGSFAWVTAREDKEYWMYTICSMRMFEEKAYLETLTHKKENKINQFFTRPWGSLVATIAFVTLLCLTGHFALHSFLIYWLFFCGVVILPYWTFSVHRRASRSTIRTLLLHIAGIKESSIGKKTYRKQLMEDMLVMLMVNLSLVLPIAHKPAFTLEQGSQSPALIVAMIILMEIVTAFILMVAFKSRRYIFCGALMLGSLSENDNFSSTSSRYHKFYRVLFWLTLVPVWTTGVCLLFSDMPFLSFTTLYIACLALPLFVYIIERGRTLRNDYHDAKNIISELKKLAPQG